ncbi:chorismate mutase [Xanthobacter sp. DSM 24535]|uniref:chorismate mutase n=1 Tax=Roseixanthobacter psychrophilus TaxID=3119917 RepID=UPI00372C5C1B
MASAGAAPPAASRPLEMLRAEIDRVDGDLLGLLNARADIVAEVGAGKSTSGAPVFRPGRQTALLNRLIARNAGPQATQTIVQVWTAIIAGSILQQKPDFRVAVAGGEAEAIAAQAFFGTAIPQARIPQAAEAIAALAAGKVEAAVLPVAGTWWLSLPEGVRIVAGAPLLRPADAPPQVLVLTRYEADPSGHDRRLVRLAQPQQAGLGAIPLAQAGGESLLVLPAGSAVPSGAVPSGAVALGLMAAPLVPRH